MRHDDDEMAEWERMAPVGREWGAPDAETLWALDARAERLAGTGLGLSEQANEWHLTWRGRVLAHWRTSETDWSALRDAVVATNDPNALSAWDEAARS